MALIGEGFLSGCGDLPERGSSISPPDATITAIHTALDCLQLKPSLKACASRVEFSSIKPRINQIAHLVATSPISEKSRKRMNKTLSDLFTLEEEGRIRWWLYRDPGISIGVVQTGRDRLPLPFIGEDFLVNLLLPQDYSPLQSEVLGTTFHEALHAGRAYQRFKEGADPAFDRPPEEEEYEATYYEMLLVKVARLAGMGGREKGAILGDFGVDLEEVVYFLDLNQIGPETQLYHYLFDWRMRYLLIRSCETLKKLLVLNPSDESLRKEIQKTQVEIKEIEERWNGYPPPQSWEATIIQAIKTQPDWVLPSFFPTEGPDLK